MLLPASTPSHAYTVRIAPTMAPFELHVPCAVTSAFRTMAWNPLEQMDRSFLFLSIPSFLRIPFFSTFPHDALDVSMEVYRSSLRPWTPPHVLCTTPWARPPWGGAACDPTTCSADPPLPSATHERTRTRTDPRLVYVPRPTSHVARPYPPPPRRKTAWTAVLSVHGRSSEVVLGPGPSASDGVYERVNLEGRARWSRRDALRCAATSAKTARKRWPSGWIPSVSSTTCSRIESSKKSSDSWCVEERNPRRNSEAKTKHRK